MTLNTPAQQDKALAARRDGLLNHMRTRTPEAFMAMTAEITGTARNEYVTPWLDAMWHGVSGDDDPISAMRALKGKVNRLRDGNLTPSALLDLQQCADELDAAWAEAKAGIESTAVNALLDEQRQLRDHRDWLLEQLKRYTPEAFFASTRAITGRVTDVYVSDELRDLWYGGDGDDPVNLARSLSGNVQRLRNEALDEDAVFDLQMLLCLLENEFWQLEREMRKEVSTHGSH